VRGASTPIPPLYPGLKKNITTQFININIPKQIIDDHQILKSFNVDHLLEKVGDPIGATRGIALGLKLSQN